MMMAGMMMVMMGSDDGDDGVMMVMMTYDDGDDGGMMMVMMGV